MRFEIEQEIAGAPDAVARIYTQPRFYELLGELPKVGEPEVLNRREDGTVVHLAVRFRFAGNLSPAVTRVIDPDKLTWTDESLHALERGAVSSPLTPDHSAARFRAEGSPRSQPIGESRTLRTI